MRRIRSILTLIALASAVPVYAQAPARAAGSAAQRPTSPPFMIQPLGWLDGGLLPYKHTQAAYEPEWKGGISPQLSFVNVPAGTKSLVLHMHDMEVARNKGTEDQLHWLVWNIPGDAKELPMNVPAGKTLADGAFQINGRGENKYLGPGAPATGPLHHYTFELIALDIPKIAVEPGTDGFETRKKVMAAMQGHVLGKAIIVGMFHRPPAPPPTS